MWRYILKRLLLMIPTLFGVAAVIFFLLRVVPGDIVELKYAGSSGACAPKEAIARERAQLGLDTPLWRQFGGWVWGLARLDFRDSMRSGRPITSVIRSRLALSSDTPLMASFVASTISIP